MTEYWHINQMKNDYKSIKLDRVIENFVQSYPYYLNLDNVKAEIAEALIDKEKKQIKKRTNSDVLDQKSLEEANNAANDYILLKPPTNSDEINNYIKYSF